MECLAFLFDILEDTYVDTSMLYSFEERAWCMYIFCFLQCHSIYYILSSLLEKEEHQRSGLVVLDIITGDNVDPEHVNRRSISAVFNNADSG